MNLMFYRSKSKRKFPEEVVMKIIARIPFPSVLKARCLSKAWRRRLSPGSQEWKKFLPILTSLSPTSCPVFLQGRTVLGYNEALQRWHRMEMHPSAIPSECFGMLVLSDEYDVSQPDEIPNTLVFIGGSLTCYVMKRRCYTAVQVTNIFTGCNDVLPISPDPSFDDKITMDETQTFLVRADGYKLVLARVVTDEHLDPSSDFKFCLEINFFDSVLKEWVNEIEALIPGGTGNFRIITCGPCVGNLLYILVARTVETSETEREEYDDEPSSDEVFLIDGMEETEVSITGMEEIQNESEDSITDTDEEDDMEIDASMTETLLSFWRYDIDSGTRQDSWILYGECDTFLEVPKNQLASRMLLCNTKLMMVTATSENLPLPHDDDGDDNENAEEHQFLMIRVFEIQFDLLCLKVVSTSPPIRPMICGNHGNIPIDLSKKFLQDVTGFSSDGRHIYICFKLDEIVDMHCYHLSEDKWSRLPAPPGGFRNTKTMTLADSTFSPGLNPFIPMASTY